MSAKAATVGLPLSNRGVSETEQPEQICVIVDWLACSVDLLSILEARRAVEDKTELLRDLASAASFHVKEVVQHVADFFFPEQLFVLGDPRPGTFYAWRVRLENAAGVHVGLIEVGGPHTARKDGTVTARIELTGDGCRMFELSGNASGHAKRWPELAALLGVCDARITRIDLAADDFRGAYPISWAVERYESGDFDRRGQRPKSRLIDDMGNRTGKTLYVGSRKSENQLRVYEKGREQGDKSSEWVRYEGEFHASNRRELPLEMLVDCAPYLVGAYPCLDFIDAVGERLRVATEKVIANCVRAVEHFRRQYGPMVNALLHASEGDEVILHRLISGTARAKLPKWCPTPDDTAQLLTTILFAPVGASLAIEPKQP